VCNSYEQQSFKSRYFNAALHKNKNKTKQTFETKQNRLLIAVCSQGHVLFESDEGYGKYAGHIARE